MTPSAVVIQALRGTLFIRENMARVAATNKRWEEAAKDALLALRLREAISLLENGGMLSIEWLDYDLK